MNTLDFPLPTVIGKYRFDKILGHGNYARVYLVEDLQYHKQFAAKVALLANERSDALFESFVTEVACLRKLDHPSIVKIYDYFREGQLLIIILEYCQNGSLNKYEKEPVPGEKLRKYLTEIFAGIQACHSSSLAHRDIKPGNILITDYDHVAIADFGISTLSIHGASVTEFTGTLPYCSPEMLSHHSYDPFASDIWALGVMTYQLASGKLPWPHRNRDEMIKAIMTCNYIRDPNIQSDIWQIIIRMLVANPEKRITIDELMKVHIIHQTKSFQQIKTSKSRSRAIIPTILSCHIKQTQSKRICNKDLLCYPKISTGSLKVHHPASLIF